MLVKTHKVSGWKREHLGGNRWRIVPTDGSEAREVEFVGAHCWGNDPKDDPARQHEDRIVLQSGPALPDWAVVWLEEVNRRACQRGRDALRAAINQADFDADMRDSWSY
jgi:hypothetical protein